MHLHRIAAVALRQYYLLRGSPTRVVPLFAWVAIDIVLWGFITRYLDTVAGAGMEWVPALLGAVLLWDFFTRVMQGVTIAFFEDVWTRNFLNLFATPMTVAEYVCGLVATSIGTSVIGLAVMLLLSTLAFGLSFAAYGVLIVPFVGVLFLFGIGLGIFAVGMVLRLGPASEWLVWPIPALLSPFVGVFYPLATLPAWMQAIGYLMPASYVFEGMRGVVLDGTFSATMLLVGAAIAVLYILLAVAFFVHIYRKAVRTGLLARYGAESAS